MPARRKRDKRRSSVQITPDAIVLFRKGFAMLRGPHDPHELRDLKIALAAALGRSKFAACPLDPEPGSLIGCDAEPAEVVLGFRTQLLKKIVT